MSATDRQRTALWDQIGPVVAALGYDLEDLSVSRVGRRSLLRIIVDSDDGIDLEAIAEISRHVDAALDVDDPFDTPFVLEVSSPGVDRPLVEPRHWRRNVGRLVETGFDGQVITARIEAVVDDEVRLSAPGRELVVAASDLAPGRVQVEFNRSTDPEG